MCLEGKLEYVGAYVSVFIYIFIFSVYVIFYVCTCMYFTSIVVMAAVKGQKQKNR